MTLDPLVCPGCRTLAGNQLELRSLERADDALACTCGRRYPIVDGVPVVMADPTGFLAGPTAAIDRDRPTEVTPLRDDDGADDAPYPRLVEHLSIYMDAHWGDRASPAPDGPGAAFAMRLLIDRIAGRSERVELAVELGCSVGRIVAELAANADHVVGLDLQLGAVRRARRILAGERVPYGRRTIGRHYAAAAAAAGDRAVAEDRVTLVCADALDPPLVPGAFERVVALNLLDSVRSPRQLINVVDGLCAPGGEVILSSPYAWQAGIVDEAERLGGADPAAEITAILREGRDLARPYRIEDEAELTWTLRRDARSAVAYWIHYVRARKT